MSFVGDATIMVSNDVREANLKIIDYREKISKYTNIDYMSKLNKLFLYTKKNEKEFIYNYYYLAYISNSHNKNIRPIEKFKSNYLSYLWEHKKEEENYYRQYLSYKLLFYGTLTNKEYTDLIKLIEQRQKKVNEFNKGGNLFVSLAKIRCKKESYNFETFILMKKDLAINELKQCKYELYEESTLYLEK